MQSSCNVVKSTVIEGSKIIAHPDIKISKPVEADNLNNTEGLNGCDIQNNISKEFDSIEVIRNEAISSANEEAKKIIVNANLEAKNILEKARTSENEIIHNANEEGYQEGYKTGYSEGYGFGMEEAEKEGQKLKDEANAALKNVMLEVNIFISNSKKEIIRLSVEIARHVLNTELTINPEAVYKIAEKVIASAVDKKQIILKVNAEDFNYIKNRKEELSIFVEDKNNIILVADPSIKKGRVKAETPSGFIDGDVETQLEAILKGLKED